MDSNVLTIEEKNLIKDYISWYGDECCPPCEIDYFLRSWYKNKEILYRIFGNKLILEQDIQVEKSFEELSNEIDGDCWAYGSKSIMFLNEFRNYFFEFWYREEIIDSEFYDNITSLITSDVLALNLYHGPTLKIPEELTKNGKPFMVPNGCKVVKIIGKIAEACGMNMDCYEDFRQVHSRVLNQKITRGTLCLSIHPLDYMTMSDNACGWSSCMQWMEEAGDYRLGTIEMLNSPYVVVAYLKASEDMEICNGSTWNNKKWRQLIIVAPEMILGNKQYPYFNDTLQGSALKIMKRLCEDANYGHYDKEAYQIENNAYNTIKDRKVCFEISTNYMYNDIYDRRMAYLNTDILPEHYYLYISGPAICTCCGCIIEDGDASTSSVSCSNCRGEFYCNHCGEWCGGNPVYIGDRMFCEYCYEHELVVCEVCGERSESYHSIPIVVGHKKEGENYDFFDYSYFVDVCDDCYCTGNSEKLFGPLHSVYNRWGSPRKVFFIEDISDEGLQRGNLSIDTIEYLLEFKKLKTYEERKKFVDKNL